MEKSTDNLVLNYVRWRSQGFGRVGIGIAFGEMGICHSALSPLPHMAPQKLMFYLVVIRSASSERKIGESEFFACNNFRSAL